MKLTQDKTEYVNIHVTSKKKIKLVIKKFHEVKGQDQMVSLMHSPKLLRDN